MALKVLHAPMNFAMQPILLMEELRRQGIDAHHVQYLPASGKHRFNFRMDKRYPMQFGQSRLNVQMQALKDALDYDYDIYHFWQRSLIFRADCTNFSGVDMPMIKARDKKVIHRFTGFDLRLPSWDLAVNPYSPYRYGFVAPFDEDTQKRYIDFLSEYVDLFLFQDPELHQFMPKAKILPRCLDLEDWAYVGIKPTDCPLIVHAPSDQICKGSRFVFQALEQLKHEGLRFKFKTVENMSHEQARQVYEKSDIIVDQLLIGATGVLTLESLALGKPVVVNLREELFRPFYGGNMPFVNANPDNITDVLRNLIKDFEWRKELSNKGRKLVEDYHSVNIIGNRCAAMYKDLMEQPRKVPSSGIDANFFLQVERAHTSKYSSFVEAMLFKCIPNKLLYYINGKLKKFPKLYKMVRKLLRA